LPPKPLDIAIRPTFAANSSNISVSKPYFDLIVKGQYTLKGSIGNPYAKLLLPDDSGDANIHGLVNFIENYKLHR